MTSSPLRTERTGSVLTIWFDNPPFNFLTSEMMADLHEVLTAAEDDCEVRAVIITSAIDDVFVSHFDVSQILGGVEAAPAQLNQHTASAALRISKVADAVPGGPAVLAKAGAGGVADLRRFHDVCRLMRGSSMVFIAAINGRSLGGGCEFALSCDFRLMADGPYVIGQPEILLGITPGGGGTQMLARIVGTSHALELSLDGAPITAQRALEIGLVNRLVQPDQLLDEARTLATRLARRSPTAVAGIKRAVHEGGSMPIEKGMHVERVAFLEAASTPSAQAAMAAYVSEVAAVLEQGKSMDEFVAEQLPRWVAGDVVEFDD